MWRAALLRREWEEVPPQRWQQAADGVTLVKLTSNTNTGFLCMADKARKASQAFRSWSILQQVKTANQIFFQGQHWRGANRRAIPPQAFQSNWIDIHEDQCCFECITWQIFSLLSLKRCPQGKNKTKKNDVFWRGEVKIHTGRKSKSSPQFLSQNLMDCEHLMH